MVETTHFHPLHTLCGIYPTDDLKVIERFTRVDEQTINYEFTVEDLSTYTDPWGRRDGLQEVRRRALRVCVSRGELRSLEHPSRRTLPRKAVHAALNALQKFDQEAARFLGLFLLHPVTGAFHHVHGSHVGTPPLKGTTNITAGRAVRPPGPAKVTRGLVEGEVSKSADGDDCAVPSLASVLRTFPSCVCFQGVAETLDRSLFAPMLPDLPDRVH